VSLASPARLTRQEGQARRREVIVVERLSFTYAGAAEPAISALSFQIKRGEIFGLLGPSGAGKSTTQKILIGLLKGYQGRVSVFERDLKHWDADYYERIGVSFELPNHYLKLTALENLTYFASLYRRRAQSPRAWLDCVGLEEDGDLMVAQFSKGMKNRLNVARALLHDPELLFLDEPTTGLDPVNARLIKKLIQEQKEAGKTVFLTTHNMTVADELCDRVAFLVDGEIRLIDAPRELKLRYGQRVVRVEYQQNGQTLSRDFPLARVGNDPHFIDLLRRGQVETIHTLEATLEDIFIKVTGRRLE
jgi:fluoroquinolone transport system ATP-binding protein